jgi:hypothetical protein
MTGPSVHPVTIFADGLALIYHEARRVRFLIKAGHLETAGWEKLVSLPKNRVPAWRELQSVRQRARTKVTAHEVARVFEQRFGRSIEDLEKLYAHPHWKHAAAVGGYAWRGVTAVVLALGHAIDAGDSAAAAAQRTALLQAHHNWCIREAAPRIWTGYVAKFGFLPWPVARRMPSIRP